jgi:hypothetical protein
MQQHYFSHPYRDEKNFGSLRVINPSLSTPGAALEEDVEHHDRKAAKGQDDARLSRPTGYTAAAPWLRRAGEDEGDILGRKKSVFPNPHPMYHGDDDEADDEGDGHAWNDAPTRRVLPLHIEKRASCTPMQTSHTNPTRRFLGTYGGQEMRAVQSQPSSMYSGYSMIESPPTHMPARFQNRSASGPGFPMARSSALPPSVVRDYDAYHNQHGVDYAGGRGAQPPIPNRSYSSAPSVASTRPVLRLNVHGLSQVDEDAEASFAPAGYSQAHPLYPAADYYPHRRDFDHPRATVEAQAGRMRQLNPPWREAQAAAACADPHERYTPIVSRQPRRERAMRVVAGNRNPRGLPHDAAGTRDWSTDLCLFCDHNIGTCTSALPPFRFCERCTDLGGVACV